eukprot:4748677-Prymnesium_polylepis.1
MNEEGRAACICLRQRRTLQVSVYDAYAVQVAHAIDQHSKAVPLKRGRDLAPLEHREQIFVAALEYKE